MLDYINYGLALIFTFEAVIKIIAFGKDYFKDGWNVFDFLIIVATDSLIILFFILDSQGAQMQATVLRSFRIGRIFRLVKQFKRLNMIFKALVITIPSLANVGSLLVLLLILYSILGV